jgi:hypothetical protein
MRKLGLGVLIGLFLAAGSASAQNVPAPPKYREVVVTAEKVEVRSGGTPTYPVTSVLNKGDRVLVVRPAQKFPGWLEIKPPSGSFSWISSMQVKKTGPSDAVVMAGEDSTPTVPVLAGSMLDHNKRGIEAVKVTRGTLVVVLGKEEVGSDGTWLPIQPTEQEVRYIPSDAVRDLTLGEAPLYQQGGPSAVGAAPVAGPPTLLMQANQAYQQRDLARAEQLYNAAAAQSKDANEKVYCYNQLSRIASESRDVARVQPGYPANNTVPGLAPGQNTALYSSTVAGTPTNRLTPTPTGPSWSGWGVLRKTAFTTKDGQPMYVLESRQDGQGAMYAATPPNLTLEARIGQWVCLYGQMSYGGDDALHAQYMVVSHVALPPPGAAIPPRR